MQLKILREHPVVGWTLNPNVLTRDQNRRGKAERGAGQTKAETK
jgi:hypothetical protein